LGELLVSVSDIFVKTATYPNFAVLENKLGTDTEVSPGKEELLILLVTKVWRIHLYQSLGTEEPVARILSV